ncbi:MAG: phytanoyl-CoA dioxygenase family protein [Verrucomicrobiae bacterium]|nr:phytanoyl-CoA dioxygenase family protein [Verrucomicrobiae bacterium]
MSNTSFAGYHVSAEQLADYERDGYLLVRQLFTTDEVKEIRDRFDAIAQSGKPIESYWTPDLSPEAANDPLKRFPRVMQPHRWDDMSKRYLLDVRVHDVLAALLGEEPIAAQTMFYYKPPGAKGQALHQDNFYLHVKPHTDMAAWTAIDACTTENGCLYVVPNSHREEIVCPETADPNESFTNHLVRIPGNKKAIPVEMGPGDVLFFNGSLIHGSPPNRSTTQWRRAFISHYLPKASTQVSGGYKPLLDFNGNDVSESMISSTDGGPCGKEFPSIGTHEKWH